MEVCVRAVGWLSGLAPAPAAALPEEVLRAMLSREPRSIALTLLSLAAVAAGSADPARSDEPKVPRPVRHRQPRRRMTPIRPRLPGGCSWSAACSTPGENRCRARRSWSMRGTCRPGGPPFSSRSKLIPLADARTDGSGRFRIDAPRTSSTRHEEFGAVAMAPGYGVGWVTLDPDDDQPTAEISLRPEQVIHGRLFDVQGRPVPDVRVSVRSIRSDLPQARARLHDRYVHRRSDGVFYWSRDAHDYPAWPRPMTTDAEGRFTVRGVGQNLHADLIVHHPRFALQTIQVDTDDDAESKPVTAALAPPQIVNVRVTYADTGQPVPHAPLQVHGRPGEVANSTNPRQTTKGRPASIPGRRTALRASRPIPRKGSRISLPMGGSIGPRARSSRPSISPCRGASWSMARSRRRAPASPSRGPRSTSPRAEGRAARS